jgi:beta-carotene 15,15'-dioxygenase
MKLVEATRLLIASVVMMALLYVQPSWAAVLALILVGLLGVPHGAADTLRMWVAFKSWPQFLAVISGYGLAALLFAVFFYYWPLPGLFIFIAISIWHFGESDEAAYPKWSVFGFGGLYIFAPFIFWQEQLQVFFQLLGLSDQSIAGLISVCIYAFYLSLAICVYLLMTNRQLHRATALYLLVSVPIALLFPPLISFSLYFALLHAPRHSLRLSAELPQWWRHPLMLLTMLATALLAVIWWYVSAEQSMQKTLVQILIIGMAAVTVPHMLLDAYLRKLHSETGA